MWHMHGLICIGPAGMTPLHWSSFGGQEAAVNLLLDAGSSASMELRDSQGLTPLCWAAYNGHGRVVRLLLQRARQIRQEQEQQAEQQQAEQQQGQQQQGQQQEHLQQQEQLQQQQPHVLAQEAAAAGPEEPAVAAAAAAAVSGYSESTLRSAAMAASSHGHMATFALLVLEIAESYSLAEADPAQLRDLVQGPAAPAPTDTALAVIAQCLSDRRRLERQQWHIDRQKAALQREREELVALRMGVQHLIVQGAGVVSRALHESEAQQSKH
jgi:ankyrin repeat protein